MSWTKPKRWWEWLLLAIPAFILVAHPVIAQRLADLEYLRGPQDVEHWHRRTFQWIGTGQQALWESGLAALVLGIWWVGGQPTFKTRVREGLWLGFSIWLVNLMLAFPGCIAIGAGMTSGEPFPIPSDPATGIPPTAPAPPHAPPTPDRQ